MAAVQPHQLAYFLAVAETGSFTRGARRAGVVQSAVSAAVTQPERELGAELFERHYHRVSLTAEGEALLPRARDVLTALDAAREAVAGARGELVGTVRLGTISFTGPLDLAGLLRSFAARHPRVEVHLRQTTSGTATSLDDLRSGALDLALVSTPADGLPGVALTEIHREPLVLVCGRDHPLASAERVGIGQLAGEPFIDFPTGWGNRAVIDHAFASAGVTRAIRTEVTDFALARTLVEHGLGLSIFPAGAVDGPADGPVARVPIRESPEWTIKLARPAPRREGTAATALARAVLDAARA